MADISGIITFFSSSHAVYAEKVAKKAGYEVELVPGPKEISPNCGVALRCSPAVIDELASLLEANSVQYEACHQYVFRQEKSLLDRLLGR